MLNSLRSQVGLLAAMQALVLTNNVTLIAVTGVAPTALVSVPKKDRRGWVVLYSPDTQLSFNL